MTRIGLISDTHGFLDSKLLELFSACHELWHAGDWGSPTIFTELSRKFLLRGVSGNIDGQTIRKDFPEKNFFVCENVKVLMIHIGGYPGHYAPGVLNQIRASKPDIFVSGHSHILKVIRDKNENLLHLNPGSAGREGFHPIRTALRFAIEGPKVLDMEAIELGPRSEILV